MRLRTSILSALASTCILAVGMLPALADVRKESTDRQVNHTFPTIVMWNGKQILSIPHMVAKDPYANRMTSWLPANDVVSILRAAGIQAYWVDGVMQLVLFAPEGWTVPASLKIPLEQTHAGKFVTIINSTTVAYAPVLRAPGSLTGVYLPVAYIMNTLRILGFHSTWTGSKLILSGTAPTNQAAPMSGSVTTLTLPLTYTNSPGLPAPTVPPVSPTTVTLPINNSLQPSTLSIGDRSTPMEDYVESGSADYIANASIGSAETWYRQVFSAQGYQLTGTSQGGNFKTGTYSESLMYSPKTQPANQQLSVTISFEGLNNGQTLIEYWVTNVLLPPRPSSTLIENNVTSVRITLNSFGPNTSNPTVQTSTVTNPQSITNLVNAINSLTQIDPPGSTSAPAYSSWQTATMAFTEADGSTITVTAQKLGQSYGDVDIDNVYLTDHQGTVWNAMIAAINN